jgi:hypothetical protein
MRQTTERRRLTAETRPASIIDMNPCLIQGCSARVLKSRTRTRSDTGFPMKRVRILTGKSDAGPVFVFADLESAVVDRAVHGDLLLAQ